LLTGSPCCGARHLYARRHPRLIAIYSTLASGLVFPVRALVAVCQGDELQEMLCRDAVLRERKPLGSVAVGSAYNGAKATTDGMRSAAQFT
jgi:hypothetical protein